LTTFAALLWLFVANLALLPQALRPPGPLGPPRAWRPAPIPNFILGPSAPDSAKADSTNAGLHTGAASTEDRGVGDEGGQAETP